MHVCKSSAITIVLLTYALMVYIAAVSKYTQSRSNLINKMYLVISYVVITDFFGFDLITMYNIATIWLEEKNDELTSINCTIKI